MHRQYIQRHRDVIARQRAQIKTLQEDKKRLEVQLRMERGEAIPYSDFVKYSGHHSF